MHETHSGFMRWAAAYNEGGPELRSRARHEVWLAGLACPVPRLEGDEPPEERLAAVTRWLAAQGPALTPDLCNRGRGDRVERRDG